MYSYNNLFLCYYYITKTNGCKAEREHMYKKKLGQTYYTNRHSCFLLQYHIVLVTKYRCPVLTGAVKEPGLSSNTGYLRRERFGNLRNEWGSGSYPHFV